jgi:hypothetical protein
MNRRRDHEWWRNVLGRERVDRQRQNSDIDRGCGGGTSPPPPLPHFKEWDMKEASCNTPPVIVVSHAEV